MSITDLVAAAGAELMTRKRISNLEFVSPQRSDDPKAVHALWPLTRDPTQALYVRATPHNDRIAVYAQVTEHHSAQQRIYSGTFVPAPGADGFFHQAEIPYDKETMIQELVPVFEAYDELASRRK